MKNLRTGIAIAVVLVIATLFFGSWYTIDASERGVVTTTGAYASTAEPGLHFKIPLVQDVKRVSIRQQSIQWPCHGESCLQAYSKDQQPAELAVSVTWHALPDAMEQIYTQYGGDLTAVVDRLIARRVPQQVKTVFGQFTAQSAIERRLELNQAISDAVRTNIDEGAPIAIDSVQIENIDYSEAYEQSVEQSKLAEVEVRRRQQQLEQEKIAAQITVTQAQAEADSRLARAKADAEAIRIRGEAEAQAIRARGDALRDNPGLVQFTQAERWDGKLPVTMLPNGAVPMLSLGAAVPQAQ